MTSVEQAKDALEQQRESAAMMTDKALSAIDSVVALSSHMLTAIGVAATLVALIGGFAIFIGAREMARKVATRRLDAYLNSGDGVAYVRRAISDEVKSQIEQKIVLVVQPSGPHSPPSTFPSPPQSGGQP